MTKTKLMIDEWKQIEVINKTSTELLRIVGKHSTLWNYSKLETIEKINNLLTQATSKAREEAIDSICDRIEMWADDGVIKTTDDIVSRIQSLKKDK